MTLTIAQVNGMKVDELKAALSGRNLSTTGKKSELADRLVASLHAEETEDVAVPPSKKQKVEEVSADDGVTGSTNVDGAMPPPVVTKQEGQVKEVKEEFTAPSGGNSGGGSGTGRSTDINQSPVVEATESSLRATVKMHATSGMSATAAALHTQPTTTTSSNPPDERRKCPYLDTVNRHLIDTDMEKVCSVSLSNLNVYVCLVCGKFFQVPYRDADGRLCYADEAKPVNSPFLHILPPSYRSTPIPTHTQGRGKATPAYTHSVQCGHFVLMHLHDARTFCLPDGYEVTDSSLDDVKRSLHPSFTAAEIRRLNQVGRSG